MAKITHRYDLPDYAAFMNMGFDLKLTDEVLKSVSDLADLVGAPTYIKTPVFPVREPGDFRNAATPLTVGGGAGATAGGYQVKEKAGSHIRLRGRRCHHRTLVITLNRFRTVNGIRFFRFRRRS